MKKNNINVIVCISCFLTISLIFGSTLTYGSRSDVEAFVTRFYQQCLGRVPDQQGLDGWVNALLNGSLTGADVANGFILSDEFINRNTTNEDFVVILYRAFFNREPDDAGYSGWLNYLYDGNSRSDALNGFVSSQEFYNLCAQYGIKADATDSGSSGGSDGGEVIEVTWKEDSLTQPLHPQASKTRLGLPAEPSDLMPHGSQIVGFGTHVGQHVEGLDHVWIPIRWGVPSRSMGDGKVTNIEKIGFEGAEYMVNVDHGNGLHCIYGEISEALVEKGQTVKHLEPIGVAREMGGFEDVGEIELYCMDENIKGGLISSNGNGYTAVSPFDYLNDDDRALLEKMHMEKAIEPYLRGEKTDGLWTPSEPFLTNKIIIHEPDKIAGEWFLIDKEWNDYDLSLLTFIESKNRFYTGNVFHLRVEDSSLISKNYVDGTYEVTYEQGRGKLTLTSKYMVQYVLFEITEDAGTDSAGAKRAQMRFEISDTPIDDFSDNVLTYQSRGIWNPRHDAWKGGWLDYR